eukprot:COSAG06_NODE_49032_length_328_cov_0.681223_1_plen_89_part_01
MRLRAATALAWQTLRARVVDTTAQEAVGGVLQRANACSEGLVVRAASTMVGATNGSGPWSQRYAQRHLGVARTQAGQTTTLPASRAACS